MRPKKNINDFLLFSDKQQCKLCLMMFHSSGQFLDHFITKHSKSHKNPHPHSHSFYYCTLCDMGNTYQKTCSLLRHIQMIHIEKCFMTIENCFLWLLKNALWLLKIAFIFWLLWLLKNALWLLKIAFLVMTTENCFFHYFQRISSRNAVFMILCNSTAYHAPWEVGGLSGKKGRRSPRDLPKKNI